MRKFILILLLVATGGWFAYQWQAAQLTPEDIVKEVDAASAAIMERADTRPEVRVLFIGNSRTFGYDMPAKIRAMADSAKAPVKLTMTVHAIGGADLEAHAASADVAALLKQRWDYVVIQGASGEQLDYDALTRFFDHGRTLIRMAQAASSHVVLFCSWTYWDAYYASETQRLEHYERIQGSYRALAKSTGVAVVNVGRSWEMVHRYDRAFPLYSDATHATEQGAYLAALAFYQYLVKGDVMAVNYSLPNITPNQVAVMKQAVRTYAY